MAGRLTLDIFFSSQKNDIREGEENRVMWLRQQGGSSAHINPEEFKIVFPHTEQESKLKS